MFQFVTLDEWSSIIRLVSKRLWLMKWFFLVYTLLASFALISLLTGVMAEHIMSESQQYVKEQENQEIQKYTEHLQELFEKRNGAEEGLTLADLKELLSNRQVQETLE